MRYASMLCFVLAAFLTPSLISASPGKAVRTRTIRIGAAQPKSRLIDHTLAPAEALSRVDKTLAELEQMVHQAGKAGCDVLALPEDTLGLGTWEAGHSAELSQVLPQAVRRMLDRLGKAAASHHMYLVCCNDTVSVDGSLRNTAFFLGRDGREIGRYDKVNMPIHELNKQRGTGFPVYNTPDLGDVGMLICYDMVFPEAARSLALGGADIIFHPTLGGAAIDDGDVSLAAFRTRAVENFVYLVVSQRGAGTMIISPHGKVIAEGKGPDDIVIADIDPFGDREGGDAMNHQRDMRARLFRERSPEAFRILTDPNPPVLKKVPETITVADAVRISAKTLTTGNERFREAEALARAGKRDEAVAAFEKLRAEFRGSWVDREAAVRLEKMRAKQPNPPPSNAGAVNVILWFDTEDYLLPADDDATKRLCEMLTQRGIRATFKLVGEKARVLEQRGRKDVIAALQKHDIGYHSDFHSVHPTPAEYLAECGWLDGIAEFVRREGDGAADVRRILAVPTLSCYGQPGSSWGPQTMAALKQIGVAPQGVPCYVDEGDHVGLDNQPFWYAGTLTVYHMGPNWTRMDLHDAAAVEPAMKKVTEIADRLRKAGGGVISIFYHPCEWVHRQFWDGVNFSRGANPPREEWKAPPQRTSEETEGAFKRFGEYVDHIRAIPGVRWITATDLPSLYPDLVRTEGATEADLDEIARQIVKNAATGLDFLRIGPRAYSVADQFELLARAVNEVAAGRSVTFPLKSDWLLGPDASPPAPAAATNIGWLAFRDAARGVSEFIQTERRVPSRVFIGPDTVAPADFLVALAQAWTYYRTHGKPPVQEGVALGRGVRLLTENRVAKDTPNLFGGWIIHKEGFRAPKLLEQARLQSWTLKPAVAKQ